MRARSLATLASLFALVACGGGGGTSSPAPSPAPAPAPADATLAVSLSGGASPGIDHLWVTVTGVALNTDASKVLGDGDPGWVTLPLAAPITVDLADPSLAQGQATLLLSQSVSALGNYAQLRLVVAPPASGAGLVASAAAKGLTWNDQVQYTDASGAHVAQLEIPGQALGVRLQTVFTLSAGTTTPLAVEWNARSSLVRRAGTGGTDRFSLRDELQLYDQQLLTALGASVQQIESGAFDSISGQLDTSQFCAAGTQSGCIHDVVASALSLSADSRFHEDVRSVAVAADGSFLISPLPSESVFDVVIHGANMRTFVIRNVFVDPTGIVQAQPTALSSKVQPLVPVLDTSGPAVSLAGAVVPPASRIVFGLTIPGSGPASGDAPYEIAVQATDPATGAWVDSVALPGGPVLDAKLDPLTFVLGSPPTFTVVTPAEGLGAWSVWTEGSLAYGTIAIGHLAAGSNTLAAPAPALASGFTSGSIAVTLAGSPSNAPDHAEIAVADDSGTVAVSDVSSLIGTGGNVSIAVPAGTSSTAATATAGVYAVALRTWKGGAEATSTLTAYGTAPIDLRAGRSGSVSLAFP